MSMYIALIPLFAIGMFNFIRRIRYAVREKNKSRLKADLFFAGLYVLTAVMIVYMLQTMK